MEPIHGEMRIVDGKPVMWVCLDDMLDWLALLPSQTEYPAAGQAAMEIREALIEAVGKAPFEEAS